MKYEKTQKGNPYNLTIKQHIFPEKSIQRFSNKSKRVHTVLVQQSKALSLKPNDAIFCARRVWDQKAEKGFMKEIEDNFQVLADVLRNRDIDLSDSDNLIITKFYLLWNFRFFYNENKIEDQECYDAIGVEREFTKDEEEILESNNINFIKANLTVPGRSITGIKLFMDLNRESNRLKDKKWGIFKVNAGEFVVPDNFLGYFMIPLTPTKYLIGDPDSRTLNKKELTEINEIAINISKSYYFARDLNNCPGYQDYDGA